LNEVKKGELLVMSINPECTIYNIGVLFQKQFDTAKDMMIFHEKLIDKCMQNLDKNKRLNIKEVDFDGTRSNVN
jgi:hypothetical protein